MGKRKSKSKVIKAKKAGLKTVFDCLFCDMRDSVEVNIRQGIGSLRCRGCNANAQYNATFISKPVDIYAEWLDETVLVNKVDDDDDDILVTSDKRQRFGRDEPSSIVQLNSTSTHTLDPSHSTLRKKLQQRSSDSISTSLAGGDDDPDEYDGEGIETQADRDFIVDDDDEPDDAFENIFDGLDDIEFDDHPSDKSDFDDGDKADSSHSSSGQGKIKKKHNKQPTTTSISKPSSPPAEALHTSDTSSAPETSIGTDIASAPPKFIEDDDDDDDVLVFSNPSV